MRSPRSAAGCRGWPSRRTTASRARTARRACSTCSTGAFFRDDGDRIVRTYFVNGRGDEALGSTFSYLDITALGRQEEWEDSPEGYPQTPRPPEWWRLPDEYGEARS